MSEIKQIVSMRLENTKREQVQALATRLYVRESDLYRFAVAYLISKLELIMDSTHVGSELLPLLLELREEINTHLNIKKHQLFKIVNSGRTPPDKFVAMADIELLLMPEHILKQHLLKLGERPKDSNDADEWLKRYLYEKYDLIGPDPLPDQI
ncbi:hypothetical protein [Methylicorpusculum sp.]|uniref:hypothetical protein n=1 Tax=Methylicorpusculum sp. TaxID=2713644 RepID=UPI002730EC68|nr:hypothetical protein [Methylicorpusculum sp.]MDP2177145.1 hypothetical protein [Methylicorpusculum sp.]MDP3531288.1 hypothetical protein [Methylicorpusculum sp.]MDZ4153236.1 hypothetical protein [Methylicorpusculum sp.]